MNGRVLVTGASGFIGGRLIGHLAARGVAVTACCRTRPQGDGRPGVTVAETGDLSVFDAWEQLLGTVHTVVHVAGLAHRKVRGDARRAYHEANVVPVTRIARAAVACGVRRVVLVSSAGVFGAASGARAFTEQDDPRPADDYARSKLAAERELARELHGTSVEWVCVRPPIVYGPGAPGNFARLVRLIDTSLPLPFASIRNRRSMIAIENLVDFLELCVSRREAAGHLFAISDDEDLSTPRLIGLMRASLGRRLRLYPCPPVLLRTAAALVQQRRSMGSLLDSFRIDCGMARRTLGWKPLCAPVAAIGAATIAIARRPEPGRA